MLRLVGLAKLLVISRSHLNLLDLVQVGICNGSVALLMPTATVPFTLFHHLCLIRHRCDLLLLLLLLLLRLLEHDSLTVRLAPRGCRLLLVDILLHLLSTGRSDIFLAVLIHLIVVPFLDQTNGVTARRPFRWH